MDMRADEAVDEAEGAQWLTHAELAAHGRRASSRAITTDQTFSPPALRSHRRLRPWR